MKKEIEAKTELVAVAQPNSNDLIFALDIGTRSVIGIVGQQNDNIFQVLASETMNHTQRAMIDGQIEDIEEVARIVRFVCQRLEERLDTSLEYVFVAAAGRSLETIIAGYELLLPDREPINYQHISNLELGAIEEACRGVSSANDRDFAYNCVGYSVTHYYLDDYPIKNLLDHRGNKIGVEIIATFLPEHVVESLYAAMQKADLKVAGLTLEPIAAINAIIPDELRLLNLALVDVGAGTTDIAISNEGSVSAYTMAAVAGDEITEAIIQRYLVDFATAETLKIEASQAKDSLIYQDILGIEYQISPAELLEVIKPAVDALGQVISEKILAANQKAPSAIFLVGGGSYTPLLDQMIADYLEIDRKKVAIGSNNYLKRVTIGDTGINGPQFATPIGIAITAGQDRGRDRLSIEVNGNTLRLYKKDNLTVMDALLMSGFQYGQIMARTGRNLVFYLNQQKKIIRGGISQSAEITLNGEPASLLSPINTADVLQFKPAIAGRDAVCTIAEALADLKQDSVAMDEQPANEAYYKLTLNGEQALPQTYLQNLDRLEISDSEPIRTSIPTETNKKQTEATSGIQIYLNETPLVLEAKVDGSPHLFVDLFNYVDIDPSQPQGNIVLKLNGHEASYIEMLSEGDIVSIYWSRSG